MTPTTSATAKASFWSWVTRMAASSSEREMPASSGRIELDGHDIGLISEAGLPAVTAAIWFGYLAPAQTPKPMIDKLAAAFRKLQSDTALDHRLSGLGAELSIIGPAEFARIIEEDRNRYGKVVKDSNLPKLN